MDDVTTELVKQILVNDANVTSVMYSGVVKELTVVYAGNAVWKYRPIEVDEFEKIMENCTAKVVLDLVRHNSSIVGVRLR